MDVLRAHFRAEEAFVDRALIEIGYQLPVWRNHYRDGAGDLESPAQINIEDHRAKEMERLFGSDPDR
jgi:hypothetical protein